MYANAIIKASCVQTADSYHPTNQCSFSGQNKNSQLNAFYSFSTVEELFSFQPTKATNIKRVHTKARNHEVAQHTN